MQSTEILKKISKTAPAFRELRGGREHDVNKYNPPHTGRGRGGKERVVRSVNSGVRDPKRILKGVSARAGCQNTERLAGDFEKPNPIALGSGDSLWVRRDDI